MRKALRILVSAVAITVATGAAMTLAAGSAEARGGVFVGIGLPPLYLGPPAYYYPPPPPVYYAPPPTYAPAPPCRPRYDWRWDGYQWRQAYVGCW
jgi:hypothetical protein